MGGLLEWLQAMGCEEALEPMVTAGFDSLDFLSLCDGEELQMLEDSLARIRPAKRSRVLRAARLLSAGAPAPAVPQGRGVESVLKTLVLASAAKLAPQGGPAGRPVEWYHETILPWEEHGALGLWRRDNKCWKAFQTALSPVCRFRAVHIVPERWSSLQIQGGDYAQYFQVCGAEFYRALVEALGAIAQGQDPVELKVPGWPMDVVARRTSDEWNAYEYECCCVWMSCRCEAWSTWGSPDDVFPYISVEGIDVHEPPQPVATWRDPRPYLLCWYAAGLTAEKGHEAFSQIQLLAKRGGYADCLVMDYPEVDVVDPSWFAKYVDGITSSIDQDPFHRGCPLVVCGHSNGGMVAAAVATTLGKRVLKAFLLSTTLSLPPAETIMDSAGQHLNIEQGNVKESVAGVWELLKEDVTVDMMTLVDIAAYIPSPFLARIFAEIHSGNLKLIKHNYLKSLVRRYRSHGTLRAVAAEVIKTLGGMQQPVMGFYGTADRTTPEWWVQRHGFAYKFIHGAGHIDIVQFTDEIMPELLEAVADIG